VPAVPLNDAAQSQPTRSEQSLERWCTAAWQTHEARRRHGSYTETWPTAADFREHWPLLAGDLIEAAWWWDGAATSSDVTRIPAELLDPPRRPREDWRRLYAAELAASAGVHLDLVGENPVAAIAKRARMTPAETDVFRLWAAGDSLGTIARTIGRHRSTVTTLLARARFRLRDLDRRRSVA
jgi:DNA-binding CsgD family transcriptional regulator